MKQAKPTANKKEKNSSTKETPIKHVVPTVAPTSTYVDDSEYSLRTAELSFDTEVYDEGDLASALEIGFIAHALELHKAKVAPEKHPDFDGESCLDCGDEILEKKNKLRG